MNGMIGRTVLAALFVAAMTLGLDPRPAGADITSDPQPALGMPGDVVPCTPLPATSSTITPDGATLYTYDTPGGVATTTVPSPNLNPLTATQDQLLANGYPPRPSDAASAAYTLWTKIVGNYHVATGNMCLTDIGAGATGGSDKFYGQNWAGEISQASSLQPYNEAAGEWYQTGFRESCGNYYEASSSWVGLGGTGYTNLAQAGTTTDLAVGGGALHMFWENWPQRAAVYFPGAVRSGDDVYADVFFSGGTSYFFVEDITTGAVGNTAISFTPNRSTVEFIDEAPKFFSSGNQAVLRHWYNGNVKWVQTEANTGKNIGAYYHHNTTMRLTGSSGVENAGPDNGMSNNYTFYDYWHHCYNSTT
jgi:peptidase A4-like protein